MYKRSLLALALIATAQASAVSMPTVAGIRQALSTSVNTLRNGFNAVKTDVKTNGVRQTAVGYGKNFAAAVVNNKKTCAKVALAAVAAGVAVYGAKKAYALFQAYRSAKATK